MGDGGFDAQDTASLVLHLDRVTVGPVFDAHCFGALFEPRGEFTREFAVQSLAAQKTHHIGAVKVQHGVAHQCRIDGGEGFSVAESPIGGPFSLVSRPIVGEGPGFEDLAMQRMESWCQ